MAICAEYDALPGIGHACGHNIIATAGLGAALALDEVAEELGLRVVLPGTPAEEHGGAKRAAAGGLLQTKTAVEELASELSVSKATVSRRLEPMINAGVLFIRAVVDPAVLGFPVEALLTLTRTNAQVHGVSEYLASLPVTRWAAASGETVMAQVATMSSHP